MPFFTSPLDGAQLHYIDYIPASNPKPWPPRSSNCDKEEHGAGGMTFVFLHGWPFSSLVYESMMLNLCETHRVRCIASDRRGFGKSEWIGNQSKNSKKRSGDSCDGGEKETDITYDTFAADTLELLKRLDLDEFVIVAASMACGESLLVYTSMDVEMQKRCKALVWLGTSLPWPLKSEENPDAPAREVWDSILAGFREDRVGFTKAAIGGVFGTNSGIEVKDGVLERMVDIVNQASSLAIERCVGLITGTDFTEDLKKIHGKEVKVLVVHGDCDFNMPASCSANLIPKYVRQAEVKIYEKAAHGLWLTHAARVTEDVLHLTSRIRTST